ncbi:phosphoesterase [Bacillus sp. JCM 19046]|nr:phosphoesterase [Bacillus sp. JCM 19045]GAF16031.1 phosphoesterase [Bacillus sp. JCM 19046]
MTILVLSDSHGWKEELKPIIERHRQSVDTIVHAGDSELDQDAPELEGVQVVAGNCDYLTSFPNEIELNWKNERILVTHGHLEGVKQSLKSLVIKAKQKGVSTVVYGHTHIAKAEMIDGILCINPGSVRLPKGNFGGSYCVIEHKTNRVDVTYFSLAGKRIPELSNYFHL